MFFVTLAADAEQPSGYDSEWSILGESSEDDAISVGEEVSSTEGRVQK